MLVQIDMTRAVDPESKDRPKVDRPKVDLDPEQQKALDYEGNCIVTGPPGTGKTEVFNALGERNTRTAAFLPFTRAARAELQERVPKNSAGIASVEVSTINSFCQKHLDEWPGSYSEQLEEFLKLKDKPMYDLVGVDEVQDLRPIHFEVIKAVKNGRLFTGGDPYQTIFTFGDAMGYQIFEELEDMDCKEFQLHNDYRSGPEIVELLNHLYPRDIVAKGPKTYNRDAVFTRTHRELELESWRLEEEGIPHSIRNRGGRDIKVLGGGSLYLMVTHACKGLGFDRVFQVDWHIPNRSSVNQTEEFNLIYVSIARASKEWYLVNSSKRMFCYPNLLGSNYRHLPRISSFLRDRK